ncbi:MAG TPA: arsenic transporter [Bacillales bacterium]|nr:arsenic transporter [Bacillales bacterium]
MLDFSGVYTISVFLLTVFFVLWKPWNLNAAVPTTIGAALLLLFQVVSLSDVFEIFQTVSSASITIISTLVMTIVLESIGFFKWVAINLVNRSKGSGLRLYVNILVLCYLMTLFFNNDGSILITTPIIIRTLKILNMKPHEKIPYLLSGAIIATATSAPIAISNIANLIALEIVGLDLNSYVIMMFLPSMVGIILIAYLLYLYYQKQIPTRIMKMELNLNHFDQRQPLPHPLSDDSFDLAKVDWGMFRTCLLVIVFTRASYFILPTIGINMEWIAIVGALLLIFISWYRKGIGMTDIFFKTPWHIFLFAFGMYILVYGLKNIGFTAFLVENLEPVITADPFYSIFATGGLLTVLSNLCNNLPSIMIGTLALTEMGLHPDTLQVAYLAGILGSDIGSLLTPIGTLATMLWMHILKENSIPVTWRGYMKASFVVIPIGLIVSLICLYLWTSLIVFQP